MNVPAIAKRTYDDMRNNPEVSTLVDFVIHCLKRMVLGTEKAKLIHQIVDESNQEVFSHPLVRQLSPCKIGCTSCCYTQVSVTEDEAELLLQHVQSRKVSLDLKRLQKQFAAGNDSVTYFKLPYVDRRCLFLNDEGACEAYEDRPSVCRTNAVLGNSSQCDTSEQVQPQRLIKTSKADIVIYAHFSQSPSSGTLPYMLGKLLGLSKSP